jgi:hypothetical protein
MNAFSEIVYLDDSAISTLRSVFESTLLEKGMTPGCAAAEELASTIVKLYLAGATESEEELLQRVRRTQAA